MSNENLPLTSEEEKELADYLTGTSGYGAAQPEEKHNVHKFLHDVVTTKDTTKLGYLTEDELGTSILPVRTCKELALFCEEIAGMAYFSEYFNKESEIITSTSLSKGGKLIDLAVVTRRELADVTKKERKINKGWFQKKNKGLEGEEKE